MKTPHTHRNSQKSVKSRHNTRQINRYIKLYFVRDEINNNKTIRLEHISNADKIVDIFSKSLLTLRFITKNESGYMSSHHEIELTKKKQKKN